MRTRLKRRFQERQASALWRQQRCMSQPTCVRGQLDGQDYINFCSNDYLGLAQHPALQEAVRDAVTQYGVGAGASQQVCGHAQAHRDAEAAFAERFGFQSALMFGNGFMANLAVIQTLVERHDVIVQDKENHASLIDAAISTHATLKRYRHADAVHAVELLAKHASQPTLLATDAVFSMSGDEAPIAELSAAARQNNAFLVLDDAHGVGVLGEGYGSLRAHGLSPDAVDVLVLPMGKAFGVYGAMVLGDSDVIDALRQFARLYIYTTAPPPFLAVAAQRSMELMFSEMDRQAQLQKNIAYFRKQAKARSIDLLPSRTAIQSWVIGTAENCNRVVASLNASGILLTAMRPPTVAKGASRLRITLNTAHTQSDIDALFDAISDVQQEVA